MRRYTDRVRRILDHAMLKELDSAEIQALLDACYRELGARKSRRAERINAELDKENRRGKAD